jgi:hypothetical protein
MQWNKGETIKFPGTLQLLLNPLAIWRVISINFIVGLPKLGNKSVIMVVVVHVSKHAHFYDLQHPFTASLVAQIFMDNIFKLHGMPHSIVSKISKFHQQFLEARGILNCISTPPIIPNMMAKLKLSISVCKHIFGVLHPSEKINGLSGYP